MMIRNTYRLSYLLVLLSLLSLGIRADTVDDYIAAQMADRHIPGMAVAVIKNGKVLKVKGYGVASLEFGVPVTPNTVFEIGSVSKQMTAAGIMLLVQDGKIRLDEKISAYLANIPEAWKVVTVRHLLTHTSGVKSYSSLDGFALLKRLNAATFIKQLSPYPLEFTPGERNIYSNSGFTLLAYIIESASGKPYMDFMRERIFRPAGMQTAGDRDPKFIIPNRAVGYQWDDGGYSGRDWDLTDLKGAGSIVATIQDLIKWDNALRGSSLLNEQSKSEMWKQYVFNNGKPSPYGFGWRITDVRGHKLIGHTGQTAGFASANYRFTDDGVEVIVLTNQDEGIGGLLATAIAKQYVPAMSLAAMKMIPDKDAARIQTVHLATIARLAGKTDPTIMSDGLIKTLSTPRQKQEDSRLARMGEFKELELVSEETIDDKTILKYRATLNGGFILWRVVFSPDKKIAEMIVDEDEWKPSKSK